MKIEQDIKLDFSDVLIRPKRSILESRSDIQLEREFKFPHSSQNWKGIPNGGVSEVKAYLLPKEELIYHADKITKPHESSN